MTLKKKIRRAKVTFENARKFPGILGKILPEMLREHGEYECIINGEKIHFTLKED